MKEYNLKCSVCEKEFSRTSQNYKEMSNYYCSRKCMSIHRTDKIELQCSNCDKPVYRTASQLAKSRNGNAFCNRSCAATYNNKNKKYGTRRSKLEAHLEKHILDKYPNVKLTCNDKSAIGSELDFYFPELRFAIELNGIFHYEPIYGEDKLERIQNNDRQKIIACYEKGIELAIINSSHIKHLTSKRKSEMESVVDLLLEKVVRRNIPNLHE